MDKSGIRGISLLRQAIQSTTLVDDGGKSVMAASEEFDDDLAIGAGVINLSPPDEKIGDRPFF